MVTKMDAVPKEQWWSVFVAHSTMRFHGSTAEKPLENLDGQNMDEPVR
ncbi:hypothetical protein RLOatenuis_0250 [Rickettsiales bacterium]|nr:hypothetical protein RLOatenuis_0250 [Rickettsiales bacterium]